MGTKKSGGGTMIFLQKISSELFSQKYMINGETDPDQVFKDIAEEIARPEKPNIRLQVQKAFEDIMTQGYFIPGGRILANARSYGHLKSRNYNNCFTIDIEDHMEGIYHSVYEDAMISRMGGGVGFDVSKLRPEGSKTTNGGEASGPISFLRVFDASADTISSGGHRRAAHIALLDIDHPDILKFITVKQGDKEKKLSKFNISVRITDAFMQAVDNDEDWQLKFGGVVYQTLKAREIYQALVRNAYTHNDPGVFFIDRVERDNNGWWAFKMDRCNPCIAGDSLVEIRFNTEIDTYKVTIQNLVKLFKDLKNDQTIYVKSYDEEAKQISWNLLQGAACTRKNAELLEITDTDTGRIIKCTPDHRILTKRGWIEAGKLQADDSIIQA
jgi:ribonucleoside-diphosphate reductase alpha chain